ncbi:linear amide C-N hydrolase [Streptomyces sp. H27-H5]|uniref:linear amide C-N hydrolase n=1 Tax=Streptomyces sp. H27-H5 TaxID=2996460 RepID=UPI00226EBBFF|nr:linear amide C-N hydrolase [Streptomyces sp. H27-H5]MCY0963171.1 linear amide C-N hydrolase [Streptomyces sp. H27-H5]
MRAAGPRQLPHLRHDPRKLAGPHLQPGRLRRSPLGHRAPTGQHAGHHRPGHQQLEHLKRYEGFAGALPLPGTTEAADRFVRAAYYLDRLPPADTAARAYAALLSVMRNAAQPFGIPDLARPNISIPDLAWVSPASVGEGNASSDRRRAAPEFAALSG